MTVQIRGLNLERLLCEAQRAGLSLHGVRRVSARCVQAEISLRQRAQVMALCDRFGWEMEETGAGVFLLALRFARRRPMLLLGALLCAGLIAVSGRCMLAVDVTGAQMYEAQMRRVLSEEGVYPGRLKSSLSLNALREKLLFCLPGLSQVSLRYAGSVLLIDCHLSREGEAVQKAGEGLDLIASQAGIVTRIAAASGTPQVRAGDAVFAGQVLIKGEERTQQGGTIPVKAQAQVFARVFAEGKAGVSLTKRTAQETGAVRTRVTLVTPFFSRVLQDAEPFELQETQIDTQKVIDLYIPLLVRSEVFSEIRETKTKRSRSDAASLAQGAAEKLAKKQLPAGALILDKWANYSMIDNEFIYATVVLEYEKDIAVRENGKNEPEMGN